MVARDTAGTTGRPNMLEPADVSRLSGLVDSLRQAHRAGGDMNSLLRKLTSVCYECGLVVDGFDWPTWISETDVRSLPLDETSIDDLRKLLTAYVRQERFIDGHLQFHLANNHLLPLIRRILDRSEPGSSGDSA
jgi:hypothetical protein